MKTLYTILTIFILASIDTAAQNIAESNDLEAKTSGEETVRLIPAPTRFYFYPNLDAYFDAEQNVYIFQQNGQWNKAKEIPSGYRGYSLYNNTRFELADYNGDKPYTLYADHKKQYPKKYSSRRQAPKINKEESKIALN